MTKKLDEIFSQYFPESHADSDHRTCESLYLVDPTNGRKVYIYSAKRNEHPEYIEQPCDCGEAADRAKAKAQILANYTENSEVKQLVLKARSDSLLDLERWAKLHDLDAAMILDGIEHMVKSNLQVPDQPRLDNSKRLAELKPNTATKRQEGVEGEDNN